MEMETKLPQMEMETKMPQMEMETKLSQMDMKNHENLDMFKKMKIKVQRLNGTAALYITVHHTFNLLKDVSVNRFSRLTYGDSFIQGIRAIFGELINEAMLTNPVVIDTVVIYDNPRILKYCWDDINSEGFTIFFNNVNTIDVDLRSGKVRIALDFLSHSNLEEIQRTVKNIIATLLLFISPPPQKYIWKYFQFIDEETFRTNYMEVQELELTPSNFFKYSKDRVFLWRNKEGQIEADVEYVSEDQKLNLTNKQLRKAIQSKRVVAKEKFDKDFKTITGIYFLSALKNVLKESNIQQLTTKEELQITQNDTTSLHSHSLYNRLPERLRNKEEVMRHFDCRYRYALLRQWNKKDLTSPKRLNALLKFGPKDSVNELVEIGQKYRFHPWTIYPYPKQTKLNLLQLFVNLNKDELYHYSKGALKKEIADPTLTATSCLRQLCVNDTEFATLDDIVDIPDERLVFIQVPNKKNTDGEKFVCFDRSTLNLKNIKMGGGFKEWVLNPESSTNSIDSEGYGGHPKQNSKILHRIIFQGGSTMYIDNAAILSKMRLHQPIYRIEKTGDPIRVGNVTGSFADSIHGQLPRVQIYSLVPVTSVEVRSCRRKLLF